MSVYMNTRDLPSAAGGNNRLSVGFTEVSVNDLGDIDSSIGDHDMVGIVVDERTSTMDYGDPRNDKRANKHCRSTIVQRKTHTEPLGGVDGLHGSP